MVRLYDSNAIKQQINEEKAAARAYVSLAEGEDRPLTADEEKAVSQHLEAIGSDGLDGTEPTGLQAKFSQALKYERLMASVVPEGEGEILERASRQPARIRVRPGFGKLQNFKGEDAAAEAYACGRWLLAVSRNHEDSRRWIENNGEQYGVSLAHTEGTDSAGGYTVPDPLTSAIIDVVDRFSIMRPLCRVVPMTSDTLKVPKRLTGLTVDYPGEATGITAADKTWGQVSLAVVKRSVMTKVSRELNEDSLIAVMDDLAMEVGRAFGLQEDNEIVNGDGTGTYGSETGILSALNANAKTVMAGGNTAFTDVTLANIETLRSTLPDKYWGMQPVFVMRRDTWNAIVIPLLRAAAGGAPITDITGAIGPNIYGDPVVFTDQMPTTAVSTSAMLFGSFRDGVVIGQRSEYDLEASDHFAFDEDVTTLKAGRRYDINVHSLGTAATDRAIVSLDTAAA